MHHSVLEFTSKVSTVGPFEDTLSAHLVLEPTASIFASVGPEINAISLFHSAIKATKIIAAITPDFNTFTMLLINGAQLGAIWVIIFTTVEGDNITLSENTKPCSFVKLPISFEDLSVLGWSAENTDTTCLAVNPVPFEGASIRPDKFAITALFHLVITSLLARRINVISWSALLFTVARHLECADLTHILERASINCLKR